jgi:hypothetical protein
VSATSPARSSRASTSRSTRRTASATPATTTATTIDTITATEARSRPPTRAALPRWAALSAGLALLALAAPQLAGAIAELSVLPELTQLRQRRPLDEPALELARERLRLAFAASGSARHLDHLAMAELALAKLRGRSGGRDLVRDAVEDASAAVRAEPANSAHWALLAAALFNAEGASRRVADIFTMALEIAPVDPAQATWRSELGFRLYDRLTTEGRRLLAEQIRTAWRREPAALVDAAIASRRVGLVRATLAGDLKALLGFEAALKRRTEARAGR